MELRGNEPQSPPKLKYRYSWADGVRCNRQNRFHPSAILHLVPKRLLMMAIRIFATKYSLQTTREQVSTRKSLLVVKGVRVFHVTFAILGEAVLSSFQTKEKGKYLEV